MNAPERILVAALGLLLGGAIWFGAARALRDSGADEASRPPLASFTLAPPSANPHALVFDAGARRREGIDPLRPPGLPAGASIDAATGLLAGVDLQPAPGDTALPWTRLAVADAAQAAADVPPDLGVLEGRLVVLAGFLMPLYEVDRIREFLLVGSHYACCFGKPPGLGGMVMVRLAGGETALTPLVEPIRVRGRLRIREQRQGPAPTDPLVLLFAVDDAVVRPLGH